MTFPVPALARICVLKIVKDIKEFCPGVNFGDLGKYQSIIGPFRYLSSRCIEAIFDYVISTGQLDSVWLCLLIVTHLRTIDFTVSPSAVNVALFKMLKQRCKHLEQLIIPNCTKVPNKALCDILQQNPSLLYLDISYKLNPKVDVSVVRTLAHSCRYLSVLKLSDFRVEDPRCLLVLCGKVALPNSVVSKAAQTVSQCHAAIETSGHSRTASLEEPMAERDQSETMEGEPDVCASGYSVVPDLSSNLQDRFINARLRYYAADSHSSIVFHHNQLSAQPSAVCETEGDVNGCVVPVVVSGESSQDTSPMDHQDVSTLMLQLLSVESSSSSQCGEGQDHEDFMCQSQDRSNNMLQIWHDPVGQNNYEVEKEHRGRLQAVSCGSITHAASGQMDVAGPSVVSQRFPTREEHENQLTRSVRGDVEYVQVREGSPSPSAADDGESHGDGDRKMPEINGEESETTEGDSDEDLYENDDPVVLPLNVEDHSSEFGCLELETLSLVNVNLNDQVCAILLQSLPNLRNLNLSDTDICNPWRLLKPTSSKHLRLLQHLDVKSTALSRTALEMIPKFHPDLRKFSISSTTLPPHMYENIGKLTGVADLELIGGQFYPCEPVEIFEKGITPVINAIGIHLQSLNLSYFAHVSFEVIVTNCPRIEHLDLSRTRISVSYPCVSLGDCCPQLISLNLGSSSVDAKEKQGSELRPVSAERALEMMLGQPKMLEELDVSGQAITDETVKSIFPDEIDHPLSTLDLSRCHHVTIAGVQHIWEHCPHLSRIDLSHCRQVTQPDFDNFRKGCLQSRPIFEQEGKLVWS